MEENLYSGYNLFKSVFMLIVPDISMTVVMIKLAVGIRHQYRFLKLLKSIKA